MGGIQSFLAIGALVLLTLTSLRFNSSVLENSTTEVENKVYLTAFSLADDLIEEIKQKAFDENTVKFTIVALSSLTPPQNFGPETGEVWPAFDDIDDYHNFSKPISLPHAENYTVTSTISYVSMTNPDQVVSSPTFAKRIEVTATSPYMRHDVTLNFVFTLHSKLKDF